MAGARATLADARSRPGHGTAGSGRRGAYRACPQTLTPDQALEADLDHARHDWRPKAVIADAARHFAAVENGGDEKLAAQAIFYHTSAALNAGAITGPRPSKSWNGCASAGAAMRSRCKTLRKLASLYFEQRQWRDRASRPCASRPRISPATMPPASPRTICARRLCQSVPQGRRRQDEAGRSAGAVL